MILGITAHPKTPPAGHSQQQSGGPFLFLVEGKLFDPPPPHTMMSTASNMVSREEGGMTKTQG
jgi:hypothetical protein